MSGLRAGAICAVFILAVTFTAATVARGNDLSATLIVVGATWAVTAILLGYLTGEMGDDNA
jgi:hypothetical protein